jgi:hypothetical protein
VTCARPSACDSSRGFIENKSADFCAAYLS